MRLPPFETFTPPNMILSATFLIVLTFIVNTFDSHIVFVSIFAMSTRDKRF